MANGIELFDIDGFGVGIDDGVRLVFGVIYMTKYVLQSCFQYLFLCRIELNLMPESSFHLLARVAFSHSNNCL